MKPNQFLNSSFSIINEQIEIYERGVTTQKVNQIPKTDDIRIQSSDKPWHWLEIPDLICVFVDMKGSTQLSVTRQDRTMASAYQLFTNTAIQIFHDFDTPYIDIKGDGVFALFNSNQIYRALAATVTFKTFVKEVFTPKIKQKTKGIIVGGHYGIDQKTVLVRKIGLKVNQNRQDPYRYNEVWAGKPINMAAKLASLANIDELLVSDRYFNNLKSDFVLKSCGCTNGIPQENFSELWLPKNVTEENKFDFNKAYSLTSAWCPIHGRFYCQNILNLDNAKS
ncbi:adenylate/guanylate cyclase domain-containing protein [Anabaena sp. CA = ATCC 33047]|nr:adenylate/guanylate cyclase domain-containing protein [Anabaena sp. CA = ATCC 33047]